MLANGGYDHQFFKIKALDELDAKETRWQDFLKDETQPQPEEFTLKDEEERERLL